MIETIFAHNSSAALAARGVAGAVLATGAAVGAGRAHLLTRSGVVAAAICGTLCVLAGWTWAAILILYFVAANLVGYVLPPGMADGAKRIVVKGGARDATQVLANGGLYSLAAALTLVLPNPLIAVGALGALAAASADTWATETGISLGRTPRSIINGTIVRAGESGGVTWAGFVGSIAGATFIAGIAVALGMSRGVGLALIIAGVGGALADSVLGATVQERRWCEACDEPTERAVHVCGSVTRRVGGIHLLDNDIINLLSTVTGFLLGVLGSRMVSIV